MFMPVAGHGIFFLAKGFQSNKKKENAMSASEEQVNVVHF
jgi:hypothetical protein